MAKNSWEALAKRSLELGIDRHDINPEVWQRSNNQVDRDPKYSRQGGAINECTRRIQAFPGRLVRQILQPIRAVPGGCLSSRAPYRIRYARSWTVLVATTTGSKCAVSEIASFETR